MAVLKKFPGVCCFTSSEYWTMINEDTLRFSFLHQKDIANYSVITGKPFLGGKLCVVSIDERVSPGLPSYDCTEPINSSSSIVFTLGFIPYDEKGRVPPNLNEPGAITHIILLCPRGNIKTNSSEFEKDWTSIYCENITDYNNELKNLGGSL